MTSGASRGDSSTKPSMRKRGRKSQKKGRANGAGAQGGRETGSTGREVDKEKTHCSEGEGAEECPAPYAGEVNIHPFNEGASIKGGEGEVRINTRRIKRATNRPGSGGL